MNYRKLLIIGLAVAALTAVLMLNSCGREEDEETSVPASESRQTEPTGTQTQNTAPENPELSETTTGPVTQPTDADGSHKGPSTQPTSGGAARPDDNGTGVEPYDPTDSVPGQDSAKPAETEPAEKPTAPTVPTGEPEAPEIPTTHPESEPTEPEGEDASAELPFLPV